MARLRFRGARSAVHFCSNNHLHLGQELTRVRRGETAGDTLLVQESGTTHLYPPVLATTRRTTINLSCTFFYWSSCDTEGGILWTFDLSWYGSCSSKFCDLKCVLERRRVPLHVRTNLLWLEESRVMEKEHHSLIHGCLCFRL